VSLAQAKLHLRVETDQTLEDPLIAQYIAAATRGAEQFCERPFASATWRALYQALVTATAPLSLRWGPAQTITTVEAMPASTDPGTPITGWRLDASGLVLWPPAEGWPAEGGVRVTYTIGPPDPATVPADVVQAILLLVGQYYDHRAGIHVGSGSVTLPYGVEWLLEPFSTRPRILAT
jgi:uncharacterized phiE125 gp8 family phage protein